jgi:hypothetical protein
MLQVVCSTGKYEDISRLEPCFGCRRLAPDAAAAYRGYAHIPVPQVQVFYGVADSESTFRQGDGM